MSNALIITEQVAVMLLLIACGYLIVKIKWLGQAGIEDLNQILLYLVMPLMVIELLNKPHQPEHTTSLLLALGFAFIAHLLGIWLSKAFFFKEVPDAKAVLRSASVLSNSGFMSIPLVDKLVGSEGTLYLVPYLLIFYVMTWTFGIRTMEPGSRQPSFKKLLLNPTIIAITLGLIMYVAGFTLPGPLSQVVSSLAATNTPFAMLLIGAQIAMMRPSFKPSTSVWKLIAVRNVLIPLILLPIILALTDNKALIYGAIIPAAAPTAATVVLFATRFKRDIKLATETLFHTTIWSIVTLSGIVWLTELLIGVI